MASLASSAFDATRISVELHQAGKHLLLAGILAGASLILLPFFLWGTLFQKDEKIELAGVLAGGLWGLFWIAFSAAQHFPFASWMPGVIMVMLCLVQVRIEHKDDRVAPVAPGPEEASA